MAELPSGTVTFLFTDLESSTRLWEELPAAMSDALARHDEILRDAVDAHDGVVLSRMGDGIAAVFASAPHAVAAAVDVQLLMAAEPWADTGPLRARMGLHTDEGRMRAPGEYMNQPLNRCARLMATAHGGQVLLSDATAAVTRGRLPEGADLVDLGEHRLRDLAEPMRVFQVAHPDLQREFPPIRSLDALPGNLPAQLTSFVGRDEELSAIATALEEWRLVTLTGTGGVGQDAPRSPGRGRSRRALRRRRMVLRVGGGRRRRRDVSGGCDDPWVSAARRALPCRERRGVPQGPRAAPRAGQL